MNVVDLLLKALGQVWGTLLHNWPFLVASVLVASAMRLYIDKDAIAGFLRRYEKGGVVAATAAAVATPLCSCGTTAIVLGMMAGSMPWAPIVAFMVASPLTSPEELFYSAGLFGWPFALAFFGASIILGLMGGMAAHMLDARGWLRNQARFTATETTCACASGPRSNSAAVTPSGLGIARAMPAVETCGCATSGQGSRLHGPNVEMALTSGCGCDTLALTLPQPVTLFASEQYGCHPDTGAWIAPAPSGGCACSDEMAAQDKPKAGRPAFQTTAYLREVALTGRRLLVFFLSFAFVGYLLNDLIPSAWITALFGSGHGYSVPLAATLGLPFYLNTEASLPLVRAMLNSGMSSGAALAFLITGAGTSIGAVAGAMTIARWRVIGLVVATLWIGAVACGFAYDALLATALM